VKAYKPNKFFDWYEKYTEQNVLITTVLFMTQFAHLTWMALFVIAGRLSGHPLWEPNSFWKSALIIFDYFEIPALLASSLLYISMIRKNENTKMATRYLVFLNLQWLHLFWITDEFVVGRFTGATARTTVLPVWLAWIAILIDFLEVPVMIDTTRRSIKILRAKFLSE